MWTFQAAEDGDEPGGHRSYISPALQTGLCDWSAKYFAQPVMKVLLHPETVFCVSTSVNVRDLDQHLPQIPEEHDLESQVRMERQWRFLRNSRVRRQSRGITQRGWCNTHAHTHTHDIRAVQSAPGCSFLHLVLDSVSHFSHNNFLL